MGRELCLCEKCGLKQCDCGYTVSQVNFREYREYDLIGLCILFDEFYKEVHQIDINESIELTSSKGPITVHFLEAEIYKFLHEDKAKIMMAVIDDRPVGFLIYHIIFDCILVSRAVFFKKPFRKRFLLRRLFLQACPELKKVIYQHYKENQPKEFPSFRKNTNVISQKGNLVTIEYTREKTNG